ncbi:MAG: hypothetical protein IJ506_05015, partial [Clostridia bacterium]|nr:hypothetical protein [Clostridia bacterium]
MKNKKLLIGLLSLTMLGCVSAGMTSTASATTPDPLLPEKGEFEMALGAQARVSSVSESGIRFETTLSEAWVKEIKETHTNAKLTFGTLIAPTANINADVENLTSETKDVQNIVHNAESDIVFENGKATLKASVTYKKDELEAEYETLYGEISDEKATALMEKTYDIELTARAYCSVATTEGTYTYYAISNDNSRTARSVINAEIIDGGLGEDEQDIINKYIGSVEFATAYADLEGDVVFNQGTANRIYVGASSKDKILDDGYVQWAELVEGKTVGDTLTVSTIVDGKITRINVSVIDEVMTDTADLSLLNNTNAEANTKTYALGKSLNASAVAMAHDNATGAGFGGLFDGMGHTISNLNIGSGAGLFGEFVEGAIVQNLALYDITVNGGFYLAENNPKYTVKNVYVKLSEESKNPKGISKMTTTQVLQNVVVEYTGANAVKIPASANSTGWDKYGVLCYGLGFGGSDATGRVAEDNYFEDVYVISPSHIMKGTLSGYYCYGKNETTDVWGRDIWNADKTNGAIHQFGDGGDLTGGNCTKYLNVPFRNTYHYDGYSEMATDDNDLTSFDGKYWVKINGTVRWKDTYVDNIDVVVTDETDEEIDEYQLQTTTDKVSVSMVDMYGNVLEGVEYTITNGDANLQREGNVFSLANVPTEDKDYVVTLKVVVEGITIERNITIKALAIRTTYTQEVYLATNSDYAGTDQYVLTTADLDAMPTDIVSASLNGVALTITDGKLPDITMDYIKKFESYGKTRETY